MMSNYIPLKDLEIYQLSMEAGRMIWEGYGRYHFGERKLFCYYS